VIRPQVGYIGTADFTKRHEAIIEGEKAAIQALPRIREILSRYRPEVGK
jgi:NTE family protein